MGKTKRMFVGVINIDPKDFYKGMGHEYGAGRKAQVHKHRNEKRGKEKLRKEIKGEY